MSVVWFLIIASALSFAVGIFLTYVIENFEAETKKLYYLIIFIGILLTVFLSANNLLSVQF